MLHISYAVGRVGRDSTAPVMMWVNLDGERKVIQLPIRVSPTLFRKMLVSRKTNNVQEVCNMYRTKAMEYYNSCLLANINITASSIIYYLKGKQTNAVYTLYNLVTDFLQLQGHRAENEISTKTYLKYRAAIYKLLEVVDKKMDVRNITNQHIQLYKQHLINKYKYQTETLAGYLKKLKALFEWGVKNNKIQHNPFMDMRITRKVKEVIALTADEVALIENVDSVERLNRVRDMFLFSCYTGLSFTDQATLTAEHIECENGVKFIKRERCKTGVQYIIPLSAKAMAILERYNYNLPNISNQKTNAYLKELGAITGITKNLHFHLARHTALTMMLNNGVPIEVVSKIAGHSKIQQTQHYSKIAVTTVLSFAKKIEGSN